MKYSEIFKNLAIGAMTLIATYVANKIDTMSTSIAQLNTNVAVIIQQMTATQSTLVDHENRLRHVEKRD